MTPQEKAIDLVHRFQEKMFFHVTDERIDINEAKQCALIAVDEVIEALHEHHWQNRLIINYWEEVKQEIEKL
jgi:hypothetical protein